VTEMNYLVAAELRRRKRRKAIRAVVVSLLTSALLSLLGGWNLMLAVGVAHAEWIHALPTIGYWWAVLLSLLISRAVPYPMKGSNK